MAAEEKTNTEATPKPAAPEAKAAPAPEVKPVAAPAAAAEAKPVAEIQTNCLACNTPLKKLRRYYRDGKYYCTKKCWISHTKKPEEEEKK